MARAVNMVQIPAMVAFQHGAGGVAAFLVSFVELTRSGPGLAPVNALSGILGLMIGALTFSGSLIAAAKLASRMSQKPQRLPFHTGLVLGALGLMLAVGFVSFRAPAGPLQHGLLVLLILLSAAFGVLFSIRIGGADMPVLISFLNATAGLAAALCGMVVENQLLIAFGATVAASGGILTHMMCKAMNRRLLGIFMPNSAPAAPAPNAAGELSAAAPSVRETRQDAASSEPEARLARAAGLLAAARSVLIVPGYGMALAQAQAEVSALAAHLAALGKEVRYAIHPVAGRMPGHMNVLLAEAGVDYDRLVEMEAINPEFASTDLALVVGACDVVNPAAISVEGTPISGMPILCVHEARYVVCCNYDDKPGYSGVENPLYAQDNTVLLQGDAKSTVRGLLEALGAGPAGEESASTRDEGSGDVAQAAGILAAAETVIIVPGYGMALAQAQFKIAELASLLESWGARVRFAIHPVAGRMPGHMNVVLAEADVDYESLAEMDAVNPVFAEADAALVVGACDVVNPAAISVEGTPISGMPILMAHEAKRVIVCNYDSSPGYSGVTNPLYASGKSILLWGDAKETVGALICSLQTLRQESSS